MKKYESKSIRESIETLSKIDRNQPIPMTHDLATALAFADIASYELCQVGFERLNAIKEIAKAEGDFVEPTVAYVQLDSEVTGKHAKQDDIKYGSRCLRTYRTLLKYQERVEELKRTHEVGEILGI